MNGSCIVSMLSCGIPAAINDCCRESVVSVAVQLDGGRVLFDEHFHDVLVTFHRRSETATLILNYLYQFHVVGGIDRHCYCHGWLLIFA